MSITFIQLKPEHIGELREGAPCIVVGLVYLKEDGVEGIEKKMRIDL